MSPILLPLLTTDVSHHVVADDQRGGDEEPHQALQDVVDDEVAIRRLGTNLEDAESHSPRHHNEEKSDVNPAEEGELLTKESSIQIGHEANKA